jgi:hypothetical protein
MVKELSIRLFKSKSTECVNGKFTNHHLKRYVLNYGPTTKISHNIKETREIMLHCILSIDDTAVDGVKRNVNLDYNFSLQPLNWNVLSHIR